MYFPDSIASIHACALAMAMAWGSGDFSGRRHGTQVVEGEVHVGVPDDGFLDDQLTISMPVPGE